MLDVNPYTFNKCKSLSLHLPWNCINTAHHTVFISARVSNIDRDLINLLKHLLHFWRLSFHHAHYGTSKESFRICYEHINNDTNEIYPWYNTVWADMRYKYCISRNWNRSYFRFSHLISIFSYRIYSYHYIPINYYFCSQHSFLIPWWVSLYICLCTTREGCVVGLLNNMFAFKELFE